MCVPSRSGKVCVSYITHISLPRLGTELCRRLLCLVGVANCGNERQLLTEAEVSGVHGYSVQRVRDKPSNMGQIVPVHGTNGIPVHCWSELSSLGLQARSGPGPPVPAERPWWTRLANRSCIDLPPGWPLGPAERGRGGGDARCGPFAANRAQDRTGQRERKENRGERRDAARPRTTDGRGCMFRGRSVRDGNVTPSPLATADALRLVRPYCAADIPGIY